MLDPDVDALLAKAELALGAAAGVLDAAAGATPDRGTERTLTYEMGQLRELQRQVAATRTRLRRTP